MVENFRGILLSSGINVRPANQVASSLTLAIPVSNIYLQHFYIEKSVFHHNHLTHLSLASLLWDIGKQNSPRWDAAERGVPSGAILFA